MLFCQWSYFHLANDAFSKWKCKFTVVIITRETHVSTWRKKPENQFPFNLKMMMMMMMMMMNCFCGRVCRRKAFKPYFQPSSLSKILTIPNLRHAASRFWTWAESEFRLRWMKLCSSDNHYIMAPRNHYTTTSLTQPCTVKVLNLAIFEIFDHFREIFYPRKQQNHEIDYQQN